MSWAFQIFVDFATKICLNGLWDNSASGSDTVYPMTINQ